MNPTFRPKSEACFFLLVPLLVTALAACGEPERSPMHTVPGMLVEPAVSRVTRFQDLAEPDANRVDRRLTVAPIPRLSPASGAPAPTPPTPPTFAALADIGPSPPLAASFLARPSNGAIPPDTNGAVGPNHLVVALNGEVAIQDRGGQLLSSVALAAFFSPAGSGFDVFDPIVRFDPLGNRFLLVAAADRASPSAAVVVAVSRSSDPTAGWFFFRLDTDPNGVAWADFPKVGVSGKWVVVVTNLLDGASAASVWACGKAALYSGTASCTRFDTAVDYFMPAAVYDPALEVAHLARYVDDDDGIDTIAIDAISGPVGAEVLTLDTAFATLPATSIIGAGSGTFLPQLSSPTGMDAGGAWIASLIYRNGSLYGTSVAFPIPATRSAIQWWQISPSGTLQQFGRLEDPTDQLFYAYPSLAVNSNNDILLGYSRFSATQYAGANYAFRSGSDPANALRADTVLKAGEARYVQSTSRNRWGDYSATSVDPVNDRDLWTIQEYAAAPVDTWSTWWGKIEPGNSWVTSTLTPVADAFVRDGTSASMNFGSDPSLLVKTSTGSGNNRISYLRFPLGAVSGPVGVARLRLHGTRPTATPATVLDRVSTVANISWSETGITWNNRPATGAVLGDVAVAGVTQYYEWDVSSYVKAQKAAGATAISFAVQMTSNTSGSPDAFSAREAGANQPQLLVSFRAAADAPPTVAVPAAASPATVPGVSTALSVLGADDQGEAALVYTWSTTGTPPAPVTFSSNGSNAARNTTATFTTAGSYTFQVVIRDGASQTATSTVNVTVTQTQTSIIVAPATATVAAGGTQAFAATARDQFGSALATQPQFVWSVSGGGSISSTGLFTAGGTAGGPFTVTAASGAQTGTATVTVGAGQTTVTVNASADAYVRDGGSAGTNFGTATTLELKATAAAGNTRVVYLRFPLSALGPNVSAARLRLFGARSSGTPAAVTDRAFAVSSTTWSETGITWNNRPALGAAVGSGVAVSTTAQYHEWTVTAHVQARKAAGAAEVSLAVVMESPISSSPDVFSSRQATSNRPQLVVTSGP